MELEVQIRVNNLLWAGGTVLFILVGSVLLGYLARFTAKRFRLSEAEQRKIYWGVVFAGPWILGFIIFVVGPALASLYYSFTDYKLGEQMEWVGLENYRELLQGQGAHGRRFQQAMYNSFYYALIGVPLQIFAALGMALLLNQQRLGMRLFRLIFYIPVILAGGPAILLAWRYLLSSNGGFINETLSNLGDNFFLFDYLNRFFIYAVEVFNGFYAGIAKGDPIGPLKYFIPAVIGVLLLFTLIRGGWSEGKRARAQAAAEILGLFVAGILIAGGIVQEPIAPIWIYAGGTAALAMIALHTAQGHSQSVRLWQVGAALVFGILLIALLLNAAAAPYLIATVVVLLLIAVSFFSKQRQARITAAAVALLGVVSLAQLIPNTTGLSLLPRYLTLNSALEQPDNLDYLQEVFPAESLSSMWFYGGIVVILAGLTLLNGRYPRVQRILLVGSFAFFTLMTVSSLIDAVRYFQAYDQIAAIEGSNNFHFALFRNAAENFPDSNRVPLWMSSELWSKPSLILITMWSSGAGMLIFLAALKSVPRVLYESAEVDGATRLQRFFKITLPMISPAIFYNIVIGVIASLQTFETVYILQNTQNRDSLASAAFFLFERTFRQLAIGQGSAVAWILVIIIVALTVLQFRYSKWVYYEV